jgi:hypothetical protein
MFHPRLALFGLILLLAVISHAAVAAVSSPRNPIAEPAPALIELTTSVSDVLGSPPAVGTLTFRNSQYPVVIYGLTITGNSVHSSSVHAEAYGVTSVASLDGTYTPVPHPPHYPSAQAVLQNDKGVELRLFPVDPATHIHVAADGIQLAAANLSIDQPTPKPPLDLLRSLNDGFGFVRFGPLTLNPTLTAAADGFSEGHAGFGGRFDYPIGNSHEFFELANETGLDATFALPSLSRITGRISGIFSMTGGGVDATGDPASLQANDYTLGDANLQWRSGDLFPTLGHDAITISGGPQAYIIGDGFLFMDGAANGGRRGALWLWPRLPFQNAGIIRFATRGAHLDAFYLQPRDEPYSDTQMSGLNLELPLGETATTGFVYAKCFHSSITARDGLNLFYWRGTASPISSMPGFTLQSSFAAEVNGSQISDANGWYVTPAYQFDHLPGTPMFSYRYASFSGGGPGSRRNFDPLFFGYTDWGTWAQGEILGNWLLTNSNLDTHQVRLVLMPRDDLTLNLIYYKFLLNSTEQTIVSHPVSPVRSKDFADEINLIADLTISSWWSMTASVSSSIPDAAAKQMSGGTTTWLQGMLASTFTF